MINNNIQNIIITIEECVEDVGYMLDINIDNGERRDGGHCAGNIDDAIKMATEQTKDLISRHI